MNVIIGKDLNEMSEIAAQHLLAHMYQPKRVNLSITGGNTPIRMYEILVPYVKGKSYFNNVHFYNFDEIPYNGTDREGITISGLRKAFLGPAGIPEENIHRLDQHNYTMQDERIAASGGLDMMLMGIGADGHFCGNLPGTTHFGDATVKVDCDAKMKELLLGEFDGQAQYVPDYYVTMGPRSVMATKHLVMIASGAKKANIIKTLLEGKVTEAVPSTVLTLHPNFTLILDKEAASLL